MTYMREFRAELETRLEALEDAFWEGDTDACKRERTAFITFVCDKTLESYRNGQQAGTPPEKHEEKHERSAGFRARKNARA
jgi:hypothetical protein